MVIERMRRVSALMVLRMKSGDCAALSSATLYVVQSCTGVGAGFGPTTFVCGAAAAGGETAVSRTEPACDWKYEMVSHLATVSAGGSPSVTVKSGSLNPAANDT